LIVSNDTIMKPPYSITTRILSLIASISEKLGAITASHLQVPHTELRKANRIKTIQSTLQIEGNTLTMDQVTAVIDNKRVIAPQKDILEVKNAIAVYDMLQNFKASSISSFLQAHALLMKGLVKQPGKFRSAGAGIVKGSQLTHLAPKASLVKGLMNDLFNYLKTDSTPLLIKSCVFHYELEFIHPFEDGNGRMGRLWQSVILKDLNPLFAFLPVEMIIKQKQSAYYIALEKSDKSGNSTPFIEFILMAIDQALAEQLQERRLPLSADERIKIFRAHIGKNEFSRKNYLEFFKNISAPTASRDLKVAVDKKMLIKHGDKRTAIYRFNKQ
jgi:Fic family protein